MASLPTLPLHCQVCNKTCTGEEPAKQHYESAAHIKKMSGMMVAASPEKKNWCEVCNISCETKEVLKIHKESIKHLGKVQKAQQLSQSLDTIESPRKVIAPAVKTSTLEKENIGSGEDFLKSSGKYYDFDGQRGYCHVCKVDLSSPKQAHDHISGDKHTKAVSNTDSATTGQSLLFIEPVKKVLKEYDFDGMRGRCNVCDIELTSEQHKQQHLNGERHRKAVSRRQQDLDKETNLTCDTCGVSFTGPESAQQHRKSEKHKKKVAGTGYQPKGAALTMADGECSPTMAQTVASMSSLTVGPTNVQAPISTPDCSEEDDFHFRVVKACRYEFVRTVDPEHLIPFMKCLTRFDEEEILATTRDKGRTQGAYKLLDIASRRNNWIDDLVRVLKDPDMKMWELADLFEKERERALT